jgi:hypothetical protein
LRPNGEPAVQGGELLHDARVFALAHRQHRGAEEALPPHVGRLGGDPCAYFVPERVGERVERLGEPAVPLGEGRAENDGRAVEIADSGAQPYGHERHLMRAAHAPRDEMADGERREDLAGGWKVHPAARDRDGGVLPGVLAGDIDGANGWRCRPSPS